MKRIEIKESKHKTKRFILKPLKKSDYKIINKEVNDNNIHETTSIPKEQTIKNTQKFIKEEINNKKAFTYKIIYKKEFIGICSLTIKDKKTAEIGYWIVKRQWGKGVATEVLTKLLEIGFEQLKLKLIYGMYLNSNYASKKVMLKNGFYNEVREKDFYKDGQAYIIHKLEINKTEYLRLKKIVL